MKENVLEVLLYLFEHYSDEEFQLIDNPSALKDELTQVGFGNTEIAKAFNWLESLLNQLEESANDLPNKNIPVRHYTTHEMQKLDRESRGFLLSVEQAGILDAASRELVIDRIMALDDEVLLDEVKWITLMVLFNQPGREEAFYRMENLMDGDMFKFLH
jgi:Smg protein